MREPGGLMARRARGASGSEMRARRKLQDRVEIEMTFGERGETIEPRRDVRMLARLHQPEMAFGQRECRRRAGAHRATARRATRWRRPRN